MIRISLLFILSLGVSSKLFSQSEADIDTATRIFERVEVEACFPGGVQAWRTYLEKNLNGSALSPALSSMQSGMAFLNLSVNAQ